eukprot:1139718-Pelagomonas_calceolata.AAC.1
MKKGKVYASQKAACIKKSGKRADVATGAELGCSKNISSVGANTEQVRQQIKSLHCFAAPASKLRLPVEFGFLAEGRERRGITLSAKHTTLVNLYYYNACRLFPFCLAFWVPIAMSWADVTEKNACLKVAPPKMTHHLSGWDAWRGIRLCGAHARHECALGCQPIGRAKPSFIFCNTKQDQQLHWIQS